MSRKNNSTATDEQIVAALLSKGTQRAAAEALGIDERTVYNRMHDGEFSALYKAAKADIIRSAVFSINNQLTAAIQTVVDVMTNEENHAAVRLQAAQTILNNASKFASRLSSEESQVTQQIESNEMGLW